VFALIKVVFCI